MRQNVSKRSIFCFGAVNREVKAPLSDLEEDQCRAEPYLWIERRLEQYLKIPATSDILDHVPNPGFHPMLLRTWRMVSGVTPGLFLPYEWHQTCKVQLGVHAGRSQKAQTSVEERSKAVSKPRDGVKSSVPKPLGCSMSQGTWQKFCDRPGVVAMITCRAGAGVH